MSVEPSSNGCYIVDSAVNVGILVSNVLTKSTSEELSKLISYAEWEPELLLFKQSGKTSSVETHILALHRCCRFVARFDLLADFYTNQVGDRMYDFSRPSECLELYGSISDKVSL